MNDLGKRLCAIVLFAGLGSAARAQTVSTVTPDGPFKTVHLMIVTPVQEAFLMAAVSDFNHEFAEQGCSSCVYRVFKMAVGKANKYNYMMTADWPSSDVYIKIHASKVFETENKKNPIMSDLSKTEFYGRYVEIQ